MDEQIFKGGVSGKCRKWSCPCKGCPEVDTCRIGCLMCDENGRAENIGFCTRLRRDGRVLAAERRANRAMKKEKE